MKLYHGTSERHLAGILEHGLLPPIMSGSVTNWESFPSNPEAVYLTAAYAPYFAMAATEEPEEKGILIEVDTDDLDLEALVPDEDFLEQVSRGQSVNWIPEWVEKADIKTRTDFFKAAQGNLGEFWEVSVESLGTVAYLDEISPNQISRIIAFDPKANPYIAMTILDPVISIMNYTIMGEKYRAITEWLMGEDISPEAFDPVTARFASLDASDAVSPKLVEDMKEHMNQIAEHLSNREGQELLFIKGEGFLIGQD